MIEGLFEKYGKLLKEKQSEKEVFITFIQETTGIIFLEEELVIQKKTIRFHTSSVKKTIFHKKELKNFFIEKGYTLVF